MREAADYRGVIHKENKRLFAYSLLAGFFYAAVPAAVALTLEMYPAAAHSALAAIPAAAGICGWLCAYRARILAGTAFAGFDLLLRREVFQKILFSGAAPDMKALAADSQEAGNLLPAADFFRRISFLFFLAAVLVYAGLHPFGNLLVVSALLALPLSALLSHVLRAARGETAAFREGLSLAAFVRVVFSAKLAGGADFLEKAFRKSASARARAKARAALPTALSCGAKIFAAGVFLALFVFTAGRFSPSLGAGLWFFCLFFIPAAVWTTASLAEFPARMRAARAAAERLQTALEAEPVVPGGETAGWEAPRGARKAPAEDLTISGLSVSAESWKRACRDNPLEVSGENPLDGFSLKVPAGQKVALAGTSSAGPACLLRVLARLAAYEEGELRLGEKDMRTLEPEELRARVDFVPRGAFLFAGTLEENIRCGSPAASDEEARGAASKLGRGDWIFSLPDGLATRVEAGEAPVWAPLALLSRTLLKRPELCLIDEADPVSDALTEVRIQEALYTVMAGRTALVAARRLSTLRLADRIIVIDKGQPAEDGSHEELLARGGLYAKIYEDFFRHQSPDYFADARPAEG
ncbi:MAG: ABC transporter ATP-binding protein/permease [Spirochaetaceae bacterium]|nr:ABC transporter ATP-binding protein/permease [Spirochaetaceae bacterium]